VGPAHRASKRTIQIGPSKIANYDHRHFTLIFSSMLPLWGHLTFHPYHEASQLLLLWNVLRVIDIG
jgi:hypothetical protein